VNQAFFMTLFFFISAYFLRESFDRKGARPFLKQRAPACRPAARLYFFGSPNAYLWNPNPHEFNHRKLAGVSSSKPHAVT
jgi:hypothetical protein